ncbi:MAG: hypothetical protein [Myoviridae sp. ctThM1]|nr:MAG: hypothetical protein [Myoviridae sp. ctThM1]
MFLKCIKSVVMNGNPEDVAFFEGKTYEFNKQAGMIVSVNENEHHHYFDDFEPSPDYWSNWFEKAE